MRTLKELKKEIQFNRELFNLIDVLKEIASSQFRQLQAKREYFFRFNQSLEGFLENVQLRESKHPFFLKESDSTKDFSGIVMITSDAGFLGELNSRVISAGLNLRKENDELVILGERGAHFLEDLGESFLYFPGITEDIKYEQAQNLRDYLIQQYLKKRFRQIFMVYPKFVSFAHREIKTEQLLPYTPETEKVASGTSQPAASTPLSEVLVEPDSERIIDYLIRVWMAQKIYDIFWESKLSEWASRVIHLEESSEVTSQINKKLQFFYFRTLHTLSDKNIREIVASRLIER